MAANIAAASILDFIEVLPISAVFARSFPGKVLSALNRQRK
jgi:hypothetical protein